MSDVVEQFEREARGGRRGGLDPVRDELDALIAQTVETVRERSGAFWERYETERVEIVPLGSVDESLAWSYGEGDRTLNWWRSMERAYYLESAARHGISFSGETPLIFEWIAVARRL